MAKKRARAKAPKPMLKIQFEDEEFLIPRIGPGRDVEPKDKIQIAEVVCKMYSTDRYTLEECLQHCGIASDSTWRKWQTEIEEIEELYKRSIETKDSTYRENLKFRARNTLEKYLDGFTVKTTEQAGLLDPESGQITTTAVKSKEIYIRPSMKAVEFVLTNVDGRNFTRNPEPYKAGNEKIPTDIRVEIIGGEIPPITREQDIKDV